MKIERKQLLRDLQDFASQGDGVIIGSPGVGKTYVLKEFRQCLKSAGIPHLLLRIDQLGDGTAETLQQELSYKGDLIEKLKSIPVSGKNAILLFDAFDAARDEQTRKRFLNLIERAIRELVKWNVVVTVRTYDAKKSQELLDLFGSPDGTEYQSKDILCRHFTIPLFNKNEILQVFDQIGCPKSIYDAGSQDFKNILAIPFNLWLLEKILRASPDLPDFSQVRSEVQLLGLFWERRIESTSNSDLRRFVLEETARQMVKECSLSIRQNDVYKEQLYVSGQAIKGVFREKVLRELLSDEILIKVSSTRQRIAFSHNILFDYATSVLLIEDEPKHLERFISEDPSRPLFLRPSLTYFFTRLWYYDSGSFWRVFWHIFPSNQSVHLRLVARLIPTSVIASEAREIDQFTPLLEKLRGVEDIANEAITRLFQALRTLQIERDALWSDFFDQVSKYLHANFAWDLATHTSDILKRATDAKVEEACGRIGRRLLAWVWQEKEKNENDWYDRLGGYWAVPIVAKTYHTNIEESRGLLEKVLQLTKEENFPIGFLSSLTEYVDGIWKHDPEFVVLIYRTVFARYEHSDEKVIRGGPIFPMATVRHQDYRMCQYRLVNHFRNFLQMLPLTAARAAIQSLNFFIIRFHINGTLDDLTKTFDFRGKSTYFVQDNSYMWDGQQYTDEPIEMADTLFEFIAELAASEDPLLDSLLDVFRDEVWVAFFWKRLLKTAAQFPKVFAPRLFELCIAKPVLLHFETSYELGLFLKAAAPEFTSDQLLQIEKSILRLPSGSEDNRESLEMRRNRLLAQIPMSLLFTNEAKMIRQEMERENSVPENRPPVTFRTWTEPVTEEKWLKDKGVDTTTPENQKLQEYSQIFEQFCNDWKEDVPTSKAIQFIFPKMQMVYSIIKDYTASNKEIINILWRKLTQCASILAGIVDSLDNDSFTFCRQVILEGAKHELPLPNPQYDAQFDSTGYSPFPRHEATKGLTLLAYDKPDKEILDAIELLANDPVPSVRMLIAMQLTNVYAKNPDRFWKILNQRSESERNLVVQECLYSTLNYIVAHRKENENKTTNVIVKLLKHTPSPEIKSGTSDPFISLLMWLVIERKNSWAIDFIKETYFNDPIQYSNMLTRVVRKTIKTYLDPKQFETNGRTENVKQAINCLNEVISVSVNKIKELCKILNQNPTEENQKKLQNTYSVVDHVISSLYYSFAHDRVKSENQTEIISDDLRHHFYEKVKPLIEQVIDFADDPDTGVMFAPTAHYFMQLLKSFLICNPKEVLHLAAGVVKSSESFGYNLDAIAVRDVVEFVEIILADHRDEVQDGEALEDLLNLLDMFAKTGWTDALKLVWRLDEVFR